MQISYRNTHYDIPEKYDEAHSRFWQRLSKPGSWWNAEQRIDIAREVRNANSCTTCELVKKALSPNAVDTPHKSVSALDPLVVEVVHRITRDQNRLSKTWYESVLARGLSDAQYVEIVGTVAAMVSIDSFCLALALPANALPKPVSGEPTQYRPTTACESEAWVPLIPADENINAESDLWPKGKTGYVIQAMSLVPDEVRTLSDLSATHYLPMHAVGSPTAQGEFLDRQQIELVASRVSALNQCYY
ncbi:MAG: hypothetical protein KUG75_06295 [Pseudomonadales bacterium]|nr:hypothetical protein [Pseudomonadales bacterium]